MLLPQLAIALTQGASAGRARLAPETDNVMRFYDEVGWQSDGDNAFRDAQLFEDLRPVSQDYIHRCHLRVNRYLAPRGTYLLKVASGPLQYPEYLTYSQGYDVRICADVPLTALRAAKEKLGDRGAYVQCDVTRLPFKDAAMDGFVSLHTMYHVPAEAQADAFRELERVLKSEKTGVVIYNWGRHSVAMTLLASRMPRVDDVPPLLRRVIPGAFSEGQKGGPGLYYHSHDYRWFARTWPHEAAGVSQCGGARACPSCGGMFTQGSSGSRCWRPSSGWKTRYPSCSAGTGSTR